MNQPRVYVYMYHIYHVQIFIQVRHRPPDRRPQGSSCNGKRLEVWKSSGSLFRRRGAAFPEDNFQASEIGLTAAYNAGAWHNIDQSYLSKHPYKSSSFGVFSGLFENNVTLNARDASAELKFNKMSSRSPARTVRVLGLVHAMHATCNTPRLQTSTHH